MKRSHALLYITCQYLIQPKSFGLVELTEEVRHKILQQTTPVIELQKCGLIGGFGSNGSEDGKEKLKKVR